MVWCDAEKGKSRVGGHDNDADEALLLAGRALLLSSAQLHLALLRRGRVEHTAAPVDGRRRRAAAQGQRILLAAPQTRVLAVAVPCRDFPVVPVSMTVLQQ